MSRRVKVLVVDDSPVVRQALCKALDDDPQLQVVGYAENPMRAAEQIEALHPDVITLDVEMPGMDGLTFLQRLMAARPMPVVMVSSKARRSSKLVLEALRAGALAVVPKPHSDYPLPTMLQDLKQILKTASTAKVRAGAPAPVERRAHPAPVLPPGKAAGSVIAVGSSTGGTVAFETFAAGLPAGHPCVVLAQHLPVDFIPRFAERLSEGLPHSRVAVAAGREALTPGHIYIAPGTHHLRVRRNGTQFQTELWDADPVNFHRPSVDVLMLSVAAVCGRAAIGVMLTGMGSDGAKGMLAMRRAGSATLAQDEGTSVVYGMPRAAMELGAAAEQHPIDRLPSRALELLVSNSRALAAS